MGLPSAGGLQSTSAPRSPSMLIVGTRHTMDTPLVGSRAGPELGMPHVPAREVAPAVVHWKSSSTASMLRRMRTDFSISLLVTPG